MNKLKDLWRKETEWTNRHMSDKAQIVIGGLALGIASFWMFHLLLTQ